MNRFCVAVVALVYVGGCASPPTSSPTVTRPAPTPTAKRGVAKPTPTPGPEDIHTARTQDGRFEATGVLLRIPSFHGGVLVRDLRTKRVVARWNTPSGATGLSFSPDGTLLAVNSPDRLVVWKWQQKQRVYAHSFDTGGGQFRIQSAFSPNGKQLAVAFGSLAVLDVGTWKEHNFSKLGDPSFVLNVTWSPNGRLLAISQEEIGAYWLVEPSSQRVRSLGYIDAYSPPLFSPDSRFIAGVTESGTFLWRVRSGKERAIGGNYNRIRSPLAFSLDSRLLVCQDADGSRGVWRTRDGKQLVSRQPKITPLSALFDLARKTK